ncbi:MAG: YbaB/EbfC family nucleoid-associated protein [Microbacterium sp.]
MSMDPDGRLTEARDRLARLRAEAHAVAAETALIAERIGQATYSGVSRGREVRVTVGADALIQRVEFTEDSLALSPRSLSAATMDAHAHAIAALRAAVEDVVATAPDSVRGLADAISAEARQILPSSHQTWRDDRR